MFNIDNKDLYSQTNITPVANEKRREIGDEAVWTLSSAKPGNGVDQLRDDNVNTFWQQFQAFIEIAIYLDFKSDESYTPNKIAIRTGTNLQDLKEASYIELKEPCGWYLFPLRTKLLDGSEKQYILTMNIQIGILQNQHSGKDTHIRQVKIFGPRDKCNQGLGFPDFKSPQITQFFSIR